MLTTTLAKWGNGQGVRLTKTLTEQAGIHIGDTLEITIDGDRIALTPVKPHHIDIPDYEAMFKGWNGSRPTEDGFAAPAGRERM